MDIKVIMDRIAEIEENFAILEENKNLPSEVKTFDISVVNKKGNMIVFDFDLFNREGYFTELINNLKDEDKVVYLLQCFVKKWLNLTVLSSRKCVALI